MANQMLVEVLWSDDWDAWREAHPEVELDLSEAYLCEHDLIGLNFANANLSGADFSGCNLLQTDFRQANLQGADFYQACLDGADFTGANLQDANLRMADLSGVKIGADQKDAFLAALGIVIVS